MATRRSLAVVLAFAGCADPGDRGPDPEQPGEGGGEGEGEIIEGCVADAWEPNDELRGAELLPSGRTEGLTMCPGDVDWYLVEGCRETRDLLVGVLFDGEQLDLAAEEWSTWPVGEQMEQRDPLDGDPAILRFSNDWWPAPQLRPIRITSEDERAGRYDVQVSAFGCEEVAFCGEDRYGGEGLIYPLDYQRTVANLRI